MSSVAWGFFLITIQTRIVLATFTDVWVALRINKPWKALSSPGSLCEVILKCLTLHCQTAEGNWAELGHSGPWEGGSTGRMLTLHGFPSTHCSSEFAHWHLYFVDHEAETTRETGQTLKLCAGSWRAALDLNRGSAMPIMVVQISHRPLWTHFCEPQNERVRFPFLEIGQASIFG